MGAANFARYDLLQIFDMRDIIELEKASAHLIGADVHIWSTSGSISGVGADNISISWEEIVAAVGDGNFIRCGISGRDYCLAPVMLEERLLAAILAGPFDTVENDCRAVSSFLAALSRIVSNIIAASRRDFDLYQQAEADLNLKVKELSYLFEISKSLHGQLDFEENSIRFLH